MVDFLSNLFSYLMLFGSSDGMKASIAFKWKMKAFDYSDTIDEVDRELFDQYYEETVRKYLEEDPDSE